MSKALSVASEAYPLIKTGGLADVVGALPAALSRHGIETRVLIPGYGEVKKAIGAAETAASYTDLFGGGARNPIRVLTSILGKLQDDNGHITIPGFYKGVEDLPKDVALDWAFQRGWKDPASGHFENFRAPVLSLTVSDDEIATVQAMRRGFSHYSNAQVEEVLLRPEDLGFSRIGHFDLFHLSLRASVCA